MDFGFVNHAKDLRQGGVACDAQCVDLDEAEDFSTFCPPCISPNRTALQIQMG